MLTVTEFVARASEPDTSGKNRTLRYAAVRLLAISNAPGLTGPLEKNRGPRYSRDTHTTFMPSITDADKQSRMEPMANL